MRIEDRFRVNVPVDEAWGVLLDIERIAPCLPGAQLQEIEGDEYRGIVKVKVGPITAQYKGAAKLEQVDDTEHRVVIRAVGRDTRGQGNASATITASMRAAGDGTEVSIDTELAITGKVAQFGRGVLADVSAKLLAQFVDNLERDVLAGPIIDVDDEASIDELVEAIEEVMGEVDALDAGAPNGLVSGNGAVKAASIRLIDAPVAQPVDLLAVSGTSVAKRLAPLVGMAVVVYLLWRVLGHRRHRRGPRRPEAPAAATPPSRLW